MSEDIRKLAELAGFSGYKRKVYTAIFSTKKATVKEVARRSSVPKPKVYTVLQELHDDGFVALEAEDPKTYSLVNPEAAFKDVLDRKKQELEHLEKAVDSASSPGTEEEKFLRILRGRDTVLNFLANQLEQTEDEYVTLARFTSSRTPLQPVMEKRVDKIDMKFLGPEQHSKEYVVKKYRKIGIETRLKDMEAIPFRFSIYDSEKLALTLSDSDDGYITIWTNYPSFVDNMRQFFEYHWNNAE